MNIKYVLSQQYECDVNEGNTIFEFQAAVSTDDVREVARLNKVRPINDVIESMLKYWRKTPVGRTKPYDEDAAKADAEAVANARLFKDGDLFYEDGEWKQR